MIYPPRNKQFAPYNLSIYNKEPAIHSYHLYSVPNVNQFLHLDVPGRYDQWLVNGLLHLPANIASVSQKEELVYSNHPFSGANC